MATSNSALPYSLYQNNNQTSSYYKKWYARARHLKTLTFEEFIKHIAAHGSSFTRAEVAGVMYKMQDCLIELLSSGVKIDFGDLGTFYLSITSSPAESIEEFNVTENIKGVHLRFAPSRKDINNLTSPELMKTTRFINVQSLVTDKERSAYNEAVKSDEEGGV